MTVKGTEGRGERRLRGVRVSGASPRQHAGMSEMTAKLRLALMKAHVGVGGFKSNLLSEGLAELEDAQQRALAARRKIEQAREEMAAGSAT